MRDSHHHLSSSNSVGLQKYKRDTSITLIMYPGGRKQRLKLGRYKEWHQTQEHCRKFVK